MGDFKLDAEHCKECIDFKKLKSFEDLSVVFHNWCSFSEKPCALLGACKKLINFKNSVEFQNHIKQMQESLEKINSVRISHI